MSYEKVRSINITEDKVILNSACNNVRPLNYSKEELPSLSKILREQGREAVEIEILKLYEEGELQQGTNKYTRALDVLYNLFKQEYDRFNWRELKQQEGESYEDYVKRSEAVRNSKEFKDLFRRALNTKLPKEKYIISKPYGSKRAYMHKLTSRRSFWSYEKRDAKKFDFEGEAERTINLFKDTEGWEVEVLE